MGIEGVLVFKSLLCGFQGLRGVWGEGSKRQALKWTLSHNDHDADDDGDNEQVPLHLHSPAGDVKLKNLTLTPKLQRFPHNCSKTNLHGCGQTYGWSGLKHVFGRFRRILSWCRGGGRRVGRPGQVGKGWNWSPQLQLRWFRVFRKSWNFYFVGFRNKEMDAY